MGHETGMLLYQAMVRRRHFLDGGIGLFLHHWEQIHGSYRKLALVLHLALDRPAPLLIGF